MSIPTHRNNTSVRRLLAFLAAASAAVAGVASLRQESGGAGRPQRPVTRVVTRRASESLLGTAFSPANFPGSSGADLDRFFGLASELGSHVVLITEWNGEAPLPAIYEVARRTRHAGMHFDLYLSPISLDSMRQRPAIPPEVSGTSFRDATVRAAFQAAVLDLAAIEPNLLGLGTEVNLLAENADEFNAYASMVRDTVSSVRARYPRQEICVSFQWDVMLVQKKFAPLDPFRGVIDVFAFTTYPSSLGDPALLPAEFYSAIRQVVPGERVGLSEVGWPAADAASEQTQAAFYARLPEMTRALRPEFVTLALLHDVAVFTGNLEPLNHVGVRYRDGRPKLAWGTLLAEPWGRR
jgi:hypothetical protein